MEMVIVQKNVWRIMDRYVNFFMEENQQKLTVGKHGVSHFLK
jgi:hypothetical protein